MKNYNVNLRLLLFAALLPSSLLVAQTDFSQVDEQARKIPFPQKQNVAQLANSLTTNLKTEKEKARAIYVWITENIRYDIKTATDEDVEAEEVVQKQKAAMVLKSKKAVCEGYANLFKALCEAAGLKATRVEGFSKNPRGKVSRIGHAWNLVRTDGEWNLIDATWGAGSVDVDDMKFTQQFNPKYFCTQPEVFILNHYPNDPMFQLLPRPVDFQTFKTNTPEQTTATSVTAFPNPKDSLDKFAALDSLARQMDSWSRMLRFDPDNGSANYHWAYYHYNKSVEIFNRQQDQMNNIARNKVKLTQAILREEGNVLDTVQAELEKSQQLASRVKSGEKMYRAANILRRELEAKQKLIAQAKKQNEELKARVKG